MQVYFGNWLRDYSQAVDVGTVKYVSAEAIRLILWILGFISFGYGTKEFEVTTERLGCYRPEEHIDNPKDYADNEDARQYDRRLRGPVDERRELAIDSELGLKAYIASENLGITTSAGLVRKLYARSIELARRYARNGNKADLYEALRLLGTGNHCLEDFSAHSNYTELSLIELGERNVFPHVGRNCQVQLRGAHHRVYPIVTGTFGGVDFLHSVTGEFDDKITQSEIQELEGTLQNAQGQSQNTSILQGLLNKVPDGVFGGNDEAGKMDQLQQNAAQHQMNNTKISPREPEEWLRYITDVQKQIYPILEWHDGIMQSITETIEKIPILPDLIENIQEQVNIFVFSLLAPFILPIIQQIKSELNTGSNAVIQSSLAAQHIVFRDDNCSDPTHSMLSKDHFSNVLNEPAGKVAGQVLRWVIPQLIACWDDERIDVDRTLNRIIRGVFHHPALRDYGDDGAADGRRLMFSVVERWWAEKSEREKDSLRDQLSRSGVEEGRNHKPGVNDHGHGSAKALGMPNMFTAAYPGAPGGFGGPSGQPAGMASQATQQLGQVVGDAVGGGALGSLVGGLASAVGGGILAGNLSGDDNTQTYNRTSYGDDGSRTQTVTQLGGQPGFGHYGQAQYSRTDDRYGGRTEEYSSYDQISGGSGGYRTETRHEERSSYGGYPSETRRYEGNSTSSHNRRMEETSGYGSSRLDSGRSEYSQLEENSGYGNRHDDERPHHGRQHHEERSYGRRDDDEHQTGYGRRHDNDKDERRGEYGHSRRDESGYASTGYNRQEESHAPSSRHGRDNRQDDYGSVGGYGRQETSNYGRSDRNEYTSGGYGRQEASSLGRPERDHYGSGGYGRQEESYGGNGRQGGDEYGSSGYGGRRRRGEDDNVMPGGFDGDGDESRGGSYDRRRRGADDEYEGGYGY